MPDESQEIEQLNIDITATNEKATTKIEEVKKSLSSLKRAINDFGKLDMSGFEQSIGKISDSLGGLKGATKNLSDIKNRLNDVSRAVPKIADLDTTRAEGNINKLTVSVRHLAEQCERLAKSDIVGTLRDLSKINFSKLGGVTRGKKSNSYLATRAGGTLGGSTLFTPGSRRTTSGGGGGYGGGWRTRNPNDDFFGYKQKINFDNFFGQDINFKYGEEAADNMNDYLRSMREQAKYQKEMARRQKELRKTLASFGGGFKNLLKSFGRIAFYRLVRSIIKTITDSIRQGIGMAYSFSSENGGQFSKSMDNLTTSVNYLRSSLGSLISNVLIALEPLLTDLINGSVDFINNLSQAFAYMANQDTWLKAIRVESEYSDVATGVAAANKKLKQSFLGIDEINVLGDAQQKLFDYEVVPVDVEKAKKTSDTLKGIAASISAIAVGLEAVKVTGTITKVLGITNGTASTISGVSSSITGLGASVSSLSGAFIAGAGAIAAFSASMAAFNGMAEGAEEAISSPKGSERLYEAGKTGSDWNIFWSGFAESWDEWFQKNGLIWNPIFGVMQGIMGGSDALARTDSAAGKGYDEYIRGYYDDKRKSEDYLRSIMAPYAAAASLLDPNDTEGAQALADAMAKALQNAMMGITINIDGKKVSDSVTVNQTSNGRRKGEVISVY